MVFLDNFFNKCLIMLHVTLNVHVGDVFTESPRAMFFLGTGKCSHDLIFETYIFSSLSREECRYHYCDRLLQ